MTKSHSMNLDVIKCDERICFSLWRPEIIEKTINSFHNSKKDCLFGLCSDVSDSSHLGKKQTAGQQEHKGKIMEESHKSLLSFTTQ